MKLSSLGFRPLGLSRTIAALEIGLDGCLSGGDCNEWGVVGVKCPFSLFHIMQFTRTDGDPYNRQCSVTTASAVGYHSPYLYLPLRTAAGAGLGLHLHHTLRVPSEPDGVLSAGAARGGPNQRGPANPNTMPFAPRAQQRAFPRFPLSPMLAWY